jgi:UDP-GlcNAc:undecaprenyl-phosphate GlcNAc-1-phosphate transferase
VGLGLPIADTLLAILRRATRGRPLFSADREHIHHRLLSIGLSHRQAVLLLYGVCLLLAVVAFTIAHAEHRTILLLLTGLGPVMLVALRRLGYLRVGGEYARQRARARERNEALRGAMREVRARLERADRLEVVWDAMKFIAPSLKAGEMRLSLVLQEGSGEEVSNVLSWRSGEEPARTAAAPCVVRLKLEGVGVKGTGGGLGEIEVCWTDGRREVERDDEIALEMLASHLEGALDRLRGPAPQDSRASNVIDLRRRTE